MKKRKTNQLKLWIIGVLAILLLAAPSGWAFTFEGTGEYNLETDLLDDDLEILDGQTVNLHATVEGYIQAHPGSVLNIYSGSVFWYVIVSSAQSDDQVDAQVSIYGTDFKVDWQCDGKFVSLEGATEFTPVPSSGSVLTGTYGNGESIKETVFQLGLWFFSDIPIKLLPPVSDDPEITIDIKPDSDENVINLKSRGVVPVAVITTDEFQAGNINPDTVEFAGASPVRSTLCDVDQDGDLDVLFHFRTQKLVDLNKDSTEATLTAMLNGTITKSSAATAGDVIQGTDKVKIKSSKQKHSFSGKHAPKPKRHVSKHKRPGRHYKGR